MVALIRGKYVHSFPERNLKFQNFSSRRKRSSERSCGLFFLLALGKYRGVLERESIFGGNFLLFKNSRRNELKTKNKADKILEKNGNDVFLLI